VLHAACEQLLAFPAATPEPLHMAVNVSLRQFRESDFINMVTAILRRTGLDPAKLDIEITESHLMHNFEATLAAMHRLGDLGVRFSIDDFGTGYSSLSRLKGLPIASVKIDQSFVCGIPDDAGNASLVRTIISLAHDLGIEVIAEGVETEAQLEFLRAHGCDKAQGYYLSRPLPAEELTALLSRNKPVFR
jgi:EAL domain-containing protein (putative c-di-GMP-specific phosphodiesterase class I)